MSAEAFSVITLVDIMTAAQAEFLLGAVVERRNILVAAGNSFLEFHKICRINYCSIRVF